MSYTETEIEDINGVHDALRVLKEVSYELNTDAIYKATNEKVTKQAILLCLDIWSLIEDWENALCCKWAAGAPKTSIKERLKRRQ